MNGVKEKSFIVHDLTGIVLDQAYKDLVEAEKWIKLMTEWNPDARLIIKGEVCCGVFERFMDAGIICRIGEGWFLWLWPGNPGRDGGCHAPMKFCPFCGKSVKVNFHE